MMHGDTNLWREESFACILQRIHSKLDILTAGQQQIATSLGVLLDVDCTPGTLLEEKHAHCETLNESHAGGTEAFAHVTSASDDDAANIADDSTAGVRFREILSCISASSETPEQAANGDGPDSPLNSRSVRTIRDSPDYTRRASLMSIGSRGGGGVLTGITASFPLSRYSKVMISFDCVGVFLMLKDSLMIPYSWVYKDAWLLNGNRIHLVAISMLSATFWTFDLLLRFVTPKDEGDDPEDAHVKTVSMRYLKSWFLFDLILVVSEWLSCAMNTMQDANATPTLKFARVIAVSRILRIVAVMKLRKLSHVKDLLLQGHEVLQVYIDLVWNILKIVMFALWMSHLGACSWILLEAESSQASNSWEMSIAHLHMAGARSFVDANLSQAYRYSIAYYWSLATMFSGSSFLHPMTSAECWFSSAYVLFGVLSVATIISSASALLMRINEANRERMAEAEKLRAFLRQHKIQPFLSLQIQLQAKKRSQMDTKVAEEEVRIICGLSTELRDQLRFNLYAPVVRGHPVWRACGSIDDLIVGAVCYFAISCRLLTPGEVVFEEKVVVEASFTLGWGSMQYSRYAQMGPHQFGRKRSLVNKDEHVRELLLPGQTACENALWTEWATIGLLEALARCEMLVCSSKGVQTVMQHVSSAAQNLMLCYGQAVLDYITLDHVDTDVSDICTPMFYDSIVTFMPQEQRVAMSVPALKVLKRYVSSRTFSHSDSLFSQSSPVAIKRPRRITAAQLLALESEVRDGSCNLSLNDSNRVIRVVKLVVVSLQREDGLICVELGEVCDGICKPRIRLPGRKVKRQETWKECVQQAIYTKFAAFAAHIDLSYGSIDVGVKESESYSIPTKYLRLAVDASIQSTNVVIRTATHQCAWEEQAIECFVSHAADDQSVVVYAWMKQCQYKFLNDSKKDGETLIASWMHAFTAGEIENARRTIVLI